MIYVFGSYCDRTEEQIMLDHLSACCLTLLTRKERQRSEMAQTLGRSTAQAIPGTSVWTVRIYIRIYVRPHSTVLSEGVKGFRFSV